MKPALVIGLGNPLMGDDGVGCRVVECLQEGGLPVPDAELVVGGTDLFPIADLLRDRTRVVLVDAVLGDDPPGTVTLDACGGACPSEIRPVHAHHLSPLRTLEILTAALPGLDPVRVELVRIAVQEVRVGEGLSPELEAMLPEIVARVRTLLRESGGSSEPVNLTDSA